MNKKLEGENEKKINPEFYDVVSKILTFIDEADKEKNIKKKGKVIKNDYKP